MPQLLAAMKHGRSTTVESTEPTFDKQGPFPRKGSGFQPGIAHMVVTAKMTKAH
jgi:hypothetical protein